MNHLPPVDNPELESPLREVVAQIVAKPIPSAALARSVERACQLKVSHPGNWRRFSPRVLVATALAAMTLLAVALFHQSRDQAWAQVVEAVREKPWVHAVGKVKSPDGAYQFETWWSVNRGISAMNSTNDVRFDDFRAGVSHKYIATTKQLVRLPASEVDKKSLQAWTVLLAALFRGDEKLGEYLADFRIVSQRRSTVERDGRTWTEYELQIQRGALAPTPLTIQVDPATKLPVSMTLLEAFDGKPTEGHYDFSYPDEGPADIFALGVPRDATLDDRMPSPEFAAVLQVQKRCRDHVHEYFAAVGTPGAPVPDKFVWRKGNRWRVDVCWPNNATWAGGEAPAAAADMAGWLKQFHHSPLLVCDGRAIFRNETGRDGPAKELPKPDWKFLLVVSVGNRESEFGPADADKCMPELHAYPDLAWSHPRMKTHFDPNPKEGPRGSVLLSVISDFSGMGVGIDHHMTRYWLDPRLGYAVVQREIVGFKTVVLEDFVQSPQGIWYPTKYRRDYDFEKKAKDGKRLFPDESAVQYRYDFKVDLPDELFEPK